jgi:YafQ family addiction module toxin component
MAYTYEISEKLDKVFRKLWKKDKASVIAIEKKVREICENPYHYKPLRAPMQHLRRVHISNSFVLIFRIDEKRKVVQLVEYEHHDYAYRK